MSNFSFFQWLRESPWFDRFGVNAASRWTACKSLSWLEVLNGVPYVHPSPYFYWSAVPLTWYILSNVEFINVKLKLFFDGNNKKIRKGWPSTGEEKKWKTCVTTKGDSSASYVLSDISLWSWNTWKHTFWILYGFREVGEIVSSD